MPPLPKLRSDLITRKHQTAYGTSVVIKDPLSGKFFRLGEAELFIVQQLDGKTPLDIIRKRTEWRFGAALPMDILQSFLFDLKKNGVLEDGNRRTRSQHRKEGRLRGSPLLLRIKLCDPCNLLNVLARRCGFFFTSYFVALSGIAIFLAAIVAAGSWGDFVQDLPRLYQPAAIPAVVLIVFFIIVAHEFGHGMTCTHFGGEVHEMGFVLILLQPAFYCNVSDAWLFPEKSKRLWVGFGGPYFELFLWSLAVFAWRATESHTWINFVALTVMATSGLKTFLNFNPLIKLDGYYLLSDYLEIPNLRKRSFRYVGQLLEKMFGVDAPDEREESLSPRERRIFGIYGVTALAGSFSVLGYIALSAGGSLIAGRTPVAFLIALGLLGMKLRRRFRRMFAKAPSRSVAFAHDVSVATTSPQAPLVAANALPQVVTHSPSIGVQAPAAPAAARSSATAVKHRDEKETTPKENSGAMPPPASATKPGSAPKTSAITAAPKNRKEEALEKHSTSAITVPPNSGTQLDTRNTYLPSPSPVPYTPRVHVTARAIRRVVWAGIGLLGIASLFVVHSELRIGGPLTILPVRNADVRTEIDGMIAQVLVNEGSVIHKGDLIAVLSTRENRSDLDRTQALIQQANAKLKLQVTGPTNDEIEVAKTAVVKAKDNFNYAKAKLDATKELFANALAARIELEGGEQLFATAKDDLAEAEQRLKVLQNGTRPEEIAQTKAEISSLATQQRFLLGQIDRAEIRSPVDGIVATPELELKEMAGQMVQKGALIAKVFQMRKLTVEISVSESEIGDVNVGEQVALKVRAYPNKTFDGSVVAIATSAFSDSSAHETGSIIPLVHAASANSGSVKTILVTTEIDNSSLLLKPGMTGHAKILCGRHRLIDLITRRFARTVKLEFWSWQ